MVDPTAPLISFRRFGALVLAASGAALLPAQVEVELVEEPEVVEIGVAIQGKGIADLGAEMAAPRFGKWRVGDPVAHKGGRIKVYACYASKRTPRLAGDIEYLAELATVFADRDVDFVAVVEPDAELPKFRGPLRVVEDPDARTTRGWTAGDPGSQNVLVHDGSGRLTFRGQFGRGVWDAIERALTGDPAIASEVRFRSQLQSVASDFDSIVGANARRQLDPILKHSPRDGFVLGLAYLATSIKLHDKEAAAAWRLSAVDRLGNAPRPLALFADLALRGEPRNRKLATQLAAALVPSTAVASNDPVVQLAYLRALVLAGMDRQVGRQAMQVRKLVMDDPDHIVTFCEILTQAETPQVHRDLCEQALEKMRRYVVRDNQMAALKYTVAKYCAEDHAAAAEVLAAYCRKVGAGMSLNNACWYLMTELPTMGRHDRFALALAEKMLERRDQLDSFEFDTAALAMFLGGRVADAVKLQQTALDKGAAGNAEYVERLKRYQAVLADGQGNSQGNGSSGGAGQRGGKREGGKGR
ncbi:MAG: hypothetical protein NXI31_18755 [bacterium]|nr:hypothetical protein [bacterium]